MDKEPLEPITVTVPQGCRISGLSQSTLWEEIRDKKIDSVKVAGRRLILYQSLKRRLTHGEGEA
jgi:hypothetical protein